LRPKRVTAVILSEAKDLNGNLEQRLNLSLALSTDSPRRLRYHFLFLNQSPQNIQEPATFFSFLE
jgi:hypothetical protein